MRFDAVVSKRLPKVGDGEQSPRLTGHRSLSVALTEPAKSEMARSGSRFGAVVGNGATFKAPITAYPTTTATWFLFNSEVSGGKTYFIDRVDFFLASGTMAVGGSVIAAVSRTPATIPTAYASTVVGSLNGGATATKAILANAVTIPAPQPVWVVIGGAENHGIAAATIGSCFSAKVEGGIAVPPQYGLAMDLVSGTGTTALYGVSVVWDELFTDNE